MNFKQRWRLLVGWALVVVAAVFVVLGWIGVSGTPDVARQLSYLASGGLGGLIAAVVGVGLLISDDLRSERSRLGRIEATLLDVNERMSSKNGSVARRSRAAAR
jgi:multisubunit Na+/H+ antiporter MnhG subunit